MTMDVEPPKQWQRLKINFVFKMPLEPRRKIKRLLRMGDEYMQKGEQQLATFCYKLSRRLAREVGTVHLLKKIEERML